MKFKYQDRNPFEGLLPGEPWFFMRARDILSVDTLRHYGMMCRILRLEQNAKEIEALVGVFSEWQEKNHAQLPKSANPKEETDRLKDQCDLSKIPPKPDSRCNLWPEVSCWGYPSACNVCDHYARPQKKEPQKF